jgi:SAM-dependent methyltransferase
MNHKTDNPFDVQAAEGFAVEIQPGTRKKANCIMCTGTLKPSVCGLFDTRFGIKGSYDIHRCASCGLQQIFPVPESAELKSLYESHYNFAGERGTLYTRMRERFLFSFLYRLWMLVDGDVSFHRSRGPGFLLDVGCNEGRGLRLYSRNGFVVEGLELSETAAAIARESGFTVHSCDITDLAPSRLYDVAVLSNVLEHSRDPRQMLVAVRRHLKPGGQIWISCPNSRSWLRSVFRSRWINWHVPFHISHFSVDTLSILLRETGFFTKEIRQVSPALWVALSIIARFCAKEGVSTRQLRNPVLVLSLLLTVRFSLFPFLCIGNAVGRGDCLLAVASAT